MSLRSCGLQFLHKRRNGLLRRFAPRNDGSEIYRSAFRGGLFASAVAIAEISGFMKNASFAG